MNSRAKVPSVCSGNLQQRKSGTGEVEARDTTLTRILVSDLMVSLIYILHLGCRVINIGFMNIRLYRRLRKLPADNTFCLSVKNIYSHNRRQIQAVFSYYTYLQAAIAVQYQHWKNRISSADHINDRVTYRDNMTIIFTCLRDPVITEFLWSRVLAIWFTLIDEFTPCDRAAELFSDTYNGDTIQTSIQETIPCFASLHPSSAFKYYFGAQISSFQIKGRGQRAAPHTRRVTTCSAAGLCESR